MARSLQPLLLFLLTYTLPATAGPADPQGFRVDTVARAPNVQFPVSLAFVPGASGRFLFTEKQTGSVRVYDRRLQAEPFVTVPVEEEDEQGLLGIALHPRYPDTPYVYLFYTRGVDRSNVVERYRDSAGIGVDPKLLLVIPRLDNATANNGGCLRFGPDGRLYVSVGDYESVPANAQDIATRKNLRGKILRLNPDGSIPADNPFPKKPFWSYGHCNPLGLTFDEMTGAMYCTEGGRGAPNAVHRVDAGANLGWPDEHRGHRPGVQTSAPLVRFEGGAQPGLTGIAVYRHRAFPRLYGRILVGGNADATVWAGTLLRGGDSLAIDPFFRSNAGYADVAVGPDGFIYLVNGPYVSSRILRLVPVRPTFVSEPPAEATQGEQYSYVPVFRGTPPGLSIVAGPEGMRVDSAAWSVVWTPTNRQALEGEHAVILRAENGAGADEQHFTVRVANLNDAPAPFALGIPPDGTALSLAGGETGVIFRWQEASDPDGDTLRYSFQLDTSAAFASAALRETTVVACDSLAVTLPPRSAVYHWRVAVSDGRLSARSTPASATLQVVFTPPSAARLEPEEMREAVLEQNFPNPFNPRTVIAYTLPRGGPVKLSVFNLLGQEVAVLFEGEQGEGTYEVDFAKGGLPSGIYFYRIQAPGFYETRKMVVEK